MPDVRMTDEQFEAALYAALLETGIRLAARGYYAIGACILILAVAEMWRRLPWRK